MIRSVVEIAVKYPKKKLQTYNFPWTKPVAGEDFYSHRLAERLEFSVAAKLNYQRYLDWKSDDNPSKPITFKPVMGHISPVSRCNFRCTMCSVTDFKNGKRCEDMSYELFAKRLGELDELVQISLTGLSELFLLHETLEPMLRLCRERKFWTNIATNGSLLHQRDWIKRLIEINLDEIVISIDGVTAETFERIRIKSNFSQVCKNSRNLNEQFNAAGVFPKRTKMQTVLQSNNRHELFKFVPFAKELGFSCIAFETEPFDWGNIDWRQRNSKVAGELEPHEIDQLLEQGKELGVEVGFVQIVQRYTALAKISSLCSWPFSKIFISSDDRVVPCCHISNPDYFEIGKLGAKKSVSDVWFGEDYTAFRNSHISGNIPQQCQSCYRNK